MVRFTVAQKPEPTARRLGPRVWSPPKWLDDRARAADLRRFLFARGLWALLFALSMVVVSVGFIITPLPSLGVALIAVWLLGRYFPSGPSDRGFPLAVHERGVILPVSFHNVPGLQRFGGPVEFRRRDIDRVERLEDAETLALVVYSRSGGGGIVERARGISELPEKEFRAVVEEFAAALETIGVKVKAGTLPGAASEEDEPQDGGGRQAPS